METAAFAGIDKVIVHHDACGTLVGIESPAAIIVGIDMMYGIVVHAGALGEAEALSFLCPYLTMKPCRIRTSRFQR